MNKILAGSAKHLELSGGLKPFEYLMLNLPFACNYKCTKCCNAGRETGSAASFLSLQEIFNLIADARDMGARVLVIAGEGEPLLDANFPEIVRKADELGLIPYVFTNGSRLENDIISFLKKHNASLVINLDSIASEKYGALSGGSGNLEKVLSNLEIVRKEFSGSISKINGNPLHRIAINTVVSESNFSELEKINAFCGNDFVWVCNLPIKIGKASSAIQFSKDFSARIPPSIPLGTTSGKKWCAYLRNGISVGANGEILACAYSLETANCFGNIRDNPLMQFAGKANSAIDKFYLKEGHSRCVLRHGKYSEFVNFLRSLNESKD
jgi:MoaA/NifB/PqqE/SkfB family radical SAM enzyme